MFSQACLILFTGGEVFALVHAGMPPPPRGRQPPGADTPWDQIHPTPLEPGTPPGLSTSLGLSTPHVTKYTPRTKYTPGTKYTPLLSTPPRLSTPPWDQVHPRTKYTPWD